MAADGPDDEYMDALDGDARDSLGGADRPSCIGSSAQLGIFASSSPQSLSPGQDFGQDLASVDDQNNSAGVDTGDCDSDDECGFGDDWIAPDPSADPCPNFIEAHTALAAEQQKVRLREQEEKIARFNAQQRARHPEINFSPEKGAEQDRGSESAAAGALPMSPTPQAARQGDIDRVLNLGVIALRAELKVAGKFVTGNKDQLVVRLLEALGLPAPARLQRDGANVAAATKGKHWAEWGEPTAGRGDELKQTVHPCTLKLGVQPVPDTPAAPRDGDTGRLRPAKAPRLAPKNTRMVGLVIGASIVAAAHTAVAIDGAAGGATTAAYNASFPACVVTEYATVNPDPAAMSQLIGTPDPVKSYGDFMTEKQWLFALDEFNKYPLQLATFRSAEAKHPSYGNWCLKEDPSGSRGYLNWTGVDGLVQYKKHLMILYLLGVTKRGWCNLDEMFGPDRILQVPWLKEATTLAKMRAFIRQLHFEDLLDPDGKGKNADGSPKLNYRKTADGKPLCPKIGAWLELLRVQCGTFIPEYDLAYDEATAM